MFRSLSFLLTGSQEGYMTVKTLLTCFESQNESKFKGLLIPGPNKPTTMQDHIKKLILQPQSWGTQIELAAMATFVQVPVFIVYILSLAIGGKESNRCTASIEQRDIDVERLDCTYVYVVKTGLNISDTPPGFAVHSGIHISLWLRARVIYTIYCSNRLIYTIYRSNRLIYTIYRSNHLATVYKVCYRGHFSV